MSKRILFIVFISFFFTDFVSNAQKTNLNFFALNRQDGLSDNAVLTITKDAKGYMWFGTRMGLNRYDGYTFRKYFAGNDSTSLPGNTIKHLLVSSTGELWVGTDRNGVCQFDYSTETFINYNFDPEEPILGSKIIKGIAEDSDSTIFIATNEGVFFKQHGENNFTALPLLKDSIKNKNLKGKGILNRTIATLTPDEDKGIWIFYDDWRISYFDRETDTYIHYQLDDNRFSYNRNFVTTALHINNKLLISGIGSGLILYNPQDASSELLLKNEEVISANHLSKSTDSLIWLSTGNGLFHYNIYTRKYHRFTSVEADNLSMTTTSLYSHYEDDIGMLWVGTMNAGLNFAFRNKPFKHLLIGLDYYYSLSNDNISEIIHDNNGNLWVCYVSGLIEFHDNKTETRSDFLLEPLVNQYSGTVFKLLQSRNGNIYAASWRGGVQKYNPEKRAFQPLFGSKEAYLSHIDAVDIRDIEEDKKGNLWLSAHGKGIYRINPANKEVKKYQFSESDSNSISNDWTYDITIDNNGNVWVGSAWGLSKINPETEETTVYYSEDREMNVSINPIEMVEFDQEGDLWISTHLGLGYYHQEMDTFYILNQKNRLPTGQVQSLLRDNKKSVWAGTTSGLIKFNLKQTGEGVPEVQDVFHFDYDDGLQSDYFNKGAAAMRFDGTMYFGGRWGIDFFNPAKIKPNEIKPTLRINSIEVFGEKIHPGTKGEPPVNEEGEIVLNYNQNMLGLEYVALTYVNVEGNQYSYMLEPLNTEWIDMNKTRDLVFSNLKPGHYSLSLRVVTDKGLVNEHEGILKFYIKPPFWQTLWFLVTINVLLILLLVFGIRWYTANLRKNKIRLEKMVHLRTMELQEKNNILEEQSENLNEVNTLLEERQQHIEEQAEELRVQTDSLSQTNTELNELNSMKDKFFSIIAHDLKNPFNTIIGFTSLLKSSYKDYKEEKRIQMIEYIHNSASSAYSLLENLLHWSRSQTNRLKVEPRRLMLKDVVDTNHQILEGMLRRKNLRFRVDVPDDVYVFADEEMLNTVLRNLLSNAAKFTSPGGIIDVHARLSDELVITGIIDTGIGMDEEELKNLFRIDTSTSKKGTSGEEGTGLGIILCKEFIKKMHGKIWVESKKGIGTSIFFSLPKS